MQVMSPRYLRLYEEVSYQAFVTSAPGNPSVNKSQILPSHPPTFFPANRANSCSATNPKPCIMKKRIEGNRLSRGISEVAAYIAVRQMPHTVL